MSVLILLFIITILVVFKTRISLRPEVIHYFDATTFGAVFGFFLALFAYWIQSGKIVSENKTLRLALPLTSIISSSVILWVFAVAIAGINNFSHPLWASIQFGLTVLALILLALKYQLNYRPK